MKRSMEIQEGTLTLQRSFFKDNSLLFFNGEKLPTISKSSFVYVTKEGKRILFQVQGRLFSGVKVIQGDKEYVLLPKMPIYSYILAGSIFLILFILSNIPPLMFYVPMISGISGFILYALAGVGYFMLSRLNEKLVYRILLYFVLLFVGFAIGYFFGSLYLYLKNIHN